MEPDQREKITRQDLDIMSDIGYSNLVAELFDTDDWPSDELVIDCLTQCRSADVLQLLALKYAETADDSELGNLEAIRAEIIANATLKKLPKLLRVAFLFSNVFFKCFLFSRLLAHVK
jgi:hypothetical protein